MVVLQLLARGKVLVISLKGLVRIWLFSGQVLVLFELDKAAYEAGLEGFLQRVKSKNKAPKNYKGPQKTKGPKPTTH